MVDMLKDFLLQLAFIAIFIFIFQIFFADRFEKKRYFWFLHSLLFGISILLCMSFRAHISHGFDLDIRIVPLLLGTLYGGFETGLFLSAVIVLYRVHLGVDLGLDTTIFTLVFSVPVIVAFQKLFMNSNRSRRILITLLLTMYYDLVGLTSVYFVGEFSFRVLQAALTQMVVSVVFVSFFVSLNEMVRETLKKNRKLQSEVKESEFAFLRSQIKPHFLYNALNSIAALCIDEPQRAEQLIVDLSQVLKSGFDFKKLETLATIENELELVKAYLNIEKARFGDRLSVEYDVDADLDIWIPPLILQPLVENAVRHGLMCNLQGGTVKISIKNAADDVVRFVIEDNGCGMSAEKQEEILQPNPTKKGVGVWNISQRIKLRYGKTIRIESTEGIGTRVCFELPA